MADSNMFEELGLSITGLGVEYPPFDLRPESLDILAKRFYPESLAMNKVLSLNRYTGIEKRSSIGTHDHPVVNDAAAPTVADLHKVFMSHGVPLAVSAAQKAIAEARIDLSHITHVVSTTCTDSANPGYDHFVCKALGMKQQVEKVLLHGVGCSGGLAALRTAANLALGHTLRKKPARVLVLALEISSTFVRSELDSINETQEMRIGTVLFSDCASALILSNGVGEAAEPVYELLGWDHRIVPDTEADLGFDVDPVGWKVVLTPRVPILTQATLQPTFDDLMATLPSLPPNYTQPADFDWALHPGGATILSGAERALSITPEHMRASYDTYMNHGNSSSATIISVLDRLRAKDMDAIAPGADGKPGKPKDYIVGCAFGPGISVEMCMLKRNFGARGLQTPPETDSEASARSEVSEDDDGKESGQAVLDTAGESKIKSAIDGLSETHASGATKSKGDEEFIHDAMANVSLD